jgi:serine/threonine protein phosphatase PrpC
VTKYAYYSKVGSMPNNPGKQNQDSFIVHPKLKGNYYQHLFGIADGHGQYGREVSSTVKQHFPSKISTTGQSTSRRTSRDWGSVRPS